MPPFFTQLPYTDFVGLFIPYWFIFLAAALPATYSVVTSARHSGQIDGGQKGARIGRVLRRGLLVLLAFGVGFLIPRAAVVLPSGYPLHVAVI